jgi:hypothetical protein
MTVCDTPLFRSFVLHRQSRREPWGLTYKKHTITRIATKSPAHRAGVPAAGWAVVNVCAAQQHSAWPMLRGED